MIGIIVVGVFFLWAFSLFWMLVKAVDNESWYWGACFFVALVVPLGLALDFASDEGPCAQYETRMMYNAATKTMMPAEFCVMRGEWVK